MIKTLRRLFGARHLGVAATAALAVGFEGAGLAGAHGTSVTVAIDSAERPYAVLLVRVHVEVDVVDGVAPEYRAAAVHHYSATWCTVSTRRLSATGWPVTRRPRDLLQAPGVQCVVHERRSLEQSGASGIR